MLFADAEFPLWAGVFLLILVLGGALFGLFVFGALGAIAGREVRRRRRSR